MKQLAYSPWCPQAPARTVRKPHTSPHRSIPLVDTILSGMYYFVRKQAEDLKGNQGRDVLRYLLCRLYTQSRGNLMVAQITLAQGTIARKLGLSRQWVGVLLHRLREVGWIEFAAPVLAGGMRGSTIFRVGGQLKRLLVMLQKSPRRKSPAKSDATNPWQFSPSPEEKRQKEIQTKENTPPTPGLLARIPLLQRWLERGKAAMA